MLGVPKIVKIGQLLTVVKNYKVDLILVKFEAQGLR